MKTPGKIISNSPAETVEWGSNLASLLDAGDTILLIGNLGAGKTVIARGVARGLGYKGVVNSPSFSLVKIYRGRLTMNHCDLYRLNPGSDIRDIGLEEMIEEDNSIAVLEWSEDFPVAETTPRWEIGIKILDDDEKRQINWKKID